ncbi:hypothetical protein OHJ16_04545 [Actinomyces israelii]|uniref:Uncharacterized protein n=1 Tax=Actinomyces israelii TaxID=1659 RepID=A0ABT4I7X3_9ACTO|nr:hypothetical protein [Actinomyces israelii]MCZ0857310.1 hypothetical protein [Actinomyces israelii]
MALVDAGGQGEDRILLAWVVAFPVILSCLFMAMFSNLDETYQATP